MTHVRNSLLAFLLMGIFISLACQTSSPPPPVVPAERPATVTHMLDLAGVKFTYPSSWHARNSSANTIVVYSPDEELQVSFTETFEKDQRIAELLSAFNKDHRGVKKGRVSNAPFNNMRHTSQSGEATNTITNKTFEWSIDTIELNKPLVIYSQVNRSVKEKYQADYEKLIQSIAPISKDAVPVAPAAQ